MRSLSANSYLQDLAMTDTGLSFSEFRMREREEQSRGLVLEIHEIGPEGLLRRKRIRTLLPFVAHRGLTFRNEFGTDYGGQLSD